MAGSFVDSPGRRYHPLLTGGLVPGGSSLFGITITLTPALVFGALIAADTDHGGGAGDSLKSRLAPEPEDGDQRQIPLEQQSGSSPVRHLCRLGDWRQCCQPERGRIHFCARGLGWHGPWRAAGWLVIHHLMLRSNTYRTPACSFRWGRLLPCTPPPRAFASLIQIATVVAGLLTGNIAAPRLRETAATPLRTFWSGVNEVLNPLLFVFVGFHVVLIDPLQEYRRGCSRSRRLRHCCSCARLTVSAIVSGLDAADAIRAQLPGPDQAVDLGRPAGRTVTGARSLAAPDSSWKPLILNISLRCRRLLDRHPGPDNQADVAEDHLRTL